MMNKLHEVIQNQLLRGYILRIAQAADPLGASVEIIVAEIKRLGYEANKDVVLKESNYLQGKDLVKIVHEGNEVLKISYDIIHITPKGIDVLEGTEIITGIELGD